MRKIFKNSENYEIFMFMRKQFSINFMLFLSLNIIQLYATLFAAIYRLEVLYTIYVCM